MKRLLYAGEEYALSKLKKCLYLRPTITRQTSEQARVIAIFLGLLFLFIQEGRANESAPVVPTTGAFFFNMIDDDPIVYPSLSEADPSDHSAQQSRITGTVVDRDGQPLEGVTVTVRGTSVTISTDAEGRFTLIASPQSGVLLISYLGHESLTQRFDAENVGPFHFILMPVDARLEEVQVSTGYQQLQRKHVTGSVDFVDNELFNRRVGASVLERLENVTTGLSYDTPRENTIENPGGIIIRGRNSIYSNVAPLLVVDNFPYDGDIEDINPNDVESITILKDAAAAAQWGARAGNGVIVITTKQGTEPSPVISLNANTTIQGRPNLYTVSTISTADYIDLERYHFDQGYFDNNLSAVRNPPPLSPVIELLARHRDGLVDDTGLEAQLAEWKTKDVRDDLTQYFYRPLVRQQYAFNLSGRAPSLGYYMSAGYDGNQANLVGSNSRRITLRSRNTYSVTSNLNIGLALTYANNTRSNGVNSGITTGSGNKRLYPYASLVDDNGKALPIARDYSMNFLKQLMESDDKVLDWLYRPYDEILANERGNDNNDFLLNTDIGYKFLDRFQLSFRYQFQTWNGQSSNLEGSESYSTRSMINQFFQPGAAIEFPVPLGGIYRETNRVLRSHQGRIQLNYQETFAQVHTINAIAGWEIKGVDRTESGSRYYGYSRIGSRVSSDMDFVTRYPRFQDPVSSISIPNTQLVSETADRFLSTYINATYTYDNRFSLSGSLREDAANLFGVETNQRGVPLWSVGGAWSLHKEPFLNRLGFSLLRLRSSYGHSGNFSRQATAYTTISYHTNLGVPAAAISNPPNAQLRWEQNRQFNIGVEMADRSARLGLSVEYFRKNNKDLMAQAPIDPTLGIMSGQVNSFYGNVASTKGDGIEGRCNLSLGNKNFNWRLNARITYVHTYVSEYLMAPSTAPSFYMGAIFNPLEGKPAYTVFSHRWGGLDPNTGDPIGYWNGEPSKAYTNIVNQTSPDSLRYHGALQAPVFGGLTIGINWKMIDLSANVAYAFGHYFRGSSLESGGIVDQWTGHGDYALRWQSPGDEMHTNVPSFVYRPPANRDNFYRYSEVLVHSASFIRLQDVRLDIDIGKSFENRFKNLNFFVRVDDINLIWVENEAGINPLQSDVARPAKSMSFGLSINL